MAHLYFTDASNNTKRSTETIYEIRAPLATFDTIDLDDWEEDTNNKAPIKKEINSESDTFDKLEKGIQELSEQKGIGSGRKLKKGENGEEDKQRCKSEQNNKPIHVKAIENLKTDNTDSVKELDTPTPTEESVQFDNVSVSTLNSESENNTPHSGGGPNDLMDPNSSENNASAEEIQTKLKEKGRKHKEKASHVKYEKIDSFSDISDQEKSENASPTPALKFRSKAYDSDSDSSDSDSGYIRTGFAPALRGTKHFRTGISSSALGLDSVDSDSTPCGSPKVTRPVIPPPLSEEDAAKRSKKKAYEKRLRRLQVTNTPIERPRSTTPINIFGLEEYVNISSPEKSPAKSSLEKLKIKLPLDEIGRSKSPRRAVKSAVGETGDAQVFSFNEELLFTHTRSAILLEEDGSKYQSPKRILVPPTLSPKLSPAHLPRTPKGLGQDSPNLPRYIYSPKSPRANKRKEEDQSAPEDKVSEQENWAQFDEVKSDSVNSEGQDLNKSANAQAENDIDKQGNTFTFEASYEILKDKSKGIDTSAKVEDFEYEEILTVKIEKSGDTTKCDIECHSAKGFENDVETKKLKEIDSNLINDKTSEECSISEKTTGALVLDDDENIESLC